MDIVGDSTRFRKATDDATASSGRLGGAFGSLKQGAASGLGLAGVVGIAGLTATAIGGVVDTIGNAITAASNLSETQGKVGVVFGSSSKEVLAWGQNAATAMGLSTNQALAAAAQYGNLFVSLGQSKSAAADMSTNMVKLAGDMASFNNASIEDTLAAIQAGLVGETEPLRRFGVNLNDAALRQQALDMGLVKTTKETLPASVKMQAAYALILEQSTTAQGDFARTSEGLANQQRIAAARVEDALTRVGSAITPIAQTVVPMLADAFVGVIGVMGQVWSAVQPVVAFLAGQLGPVIRQVATFVSGQLVPAVTAAARTAFPIVSAAIKTAADVLGFLARAISPVVQALASVLLPAFRAVAGFVTGTIVPVISNVARAVMPALSTAARVLGPIVTAIFNQIANNIRSAATLIGIGINQLGNVFRTVFGVIGTVVRTAATVIGNVANAIRTIFTGIVNTATSMYNGIRNAVGNIIGAVAGMPGRIAGVARGMWDSIWNGFRNVVNSIIRGWNSISFSVPRVDLGPLGSVGGFSIGTPNLPYLHTGGIVPGAPGSNVLTVLQAGEEVRSRVNARDRGGVTIVIQGPIYGGPAGLDELAADLAARLRLQGVT